MNQLEYVLNQEEIVWNDSYNKDYIKKLKTIPGQNGKYCQACNVEFEEDWD